VLTQSVLDKRQTEPLPSYPPHSSQQKSVALWQRLVRVWKNFSFRTKLTLLLLGSITLPIIAVTQGVVTIAERQLLNSLEQNLIVDLRALQDKINDNQDEVIEETTKLASLVTTAGIEVSDPNNAAVVNDILLGYAQTDADESFYIITDASGRTVAQKIQTIEEDFSHYSPLPTEEDTEPELRNVSLPPGIELGDIAIIRNALSTGNSLSGIELLQGEFLQRLGLSEQAAIGIREQKIEGLPEEEQPFPEGTYNVDGGKAGLVVMAVQPLKVEDRVVGTAIIGTLINRNYEIVDKIKEETEISTVTIFAQDWRVSTNVPYTDGKTRAIGTRLSRTIADKVLNRGEEFLGRTDILGQEYIGKYSPIYSHQKQLNPQQAEVVGIGYVGEPEVNLDNSIRHLVLVGYGIGGTILILASLVAIPLAASFSKPLQNLARFAQQVGNGEKGLQLKITERQDEIGILSQEINQMVTRIESNVDQERQQKEMLQAELIQLLTTVEDAAEGNLTVRAEISASEVAIVADFFNAIVESLRELVTQVKDAATQVNSSVGENETAISQLVEKTLQQATQINQTLTSVEQMTLSIQEVANNAKAAAEVARFAAAQAETGGEAIEKTVKSIMELRATVAETGNKVKQLGESSQQIFKIISLINQIALKTNLLAVNASIEAARAGEEGRGFAVVAEEVGKLASQSAAATKEIEQIVTNIQLETTQVSQAMEVGIAQVVEGTHQVSEAKHSLEKIFEVSRQIDQLVATISDNTVSQAETSKSVKELIEQIATISKNTADSSRQISTSLHETVEIVEQLQTSVGKFKVEEER
jgi:methyl-accepting chemotaxis protein